MQCPLWLIAASCFGPVLPTPHSDAVAGCHFVPGKKLFLTAAYDGTIAVWSYPDPKKLEVSKHRVSIKGADLDGGSSFAFGGFDTDIRLYDVRTKAIRSININDVSSSRIAFLKEDLVVAATTTGKLLLLDTRTSRSTTKTGHEKAIYGLAVSADRKHFASSAKGGRIRIWNAESFAVERVLEGKGAGCSIAFSPNNNLLASGEGDNKVALWDLESKTVIKRIGGHSDLITSLRFSKDGKIIFSASHDKTVCKIDLKSEKAEKIVEFEEEICSMAIDPTERFLVVGGLQGSVGFFELR